MGLKNGAKARGLGKRACGIERKPENLVGGPTNKRRRGLRRNECNAGKGEVFQSVFRSLGRGRVVRKPVFVVLCISHCLLFLSKEGDYIVVGKIKRLR